MANKIICQVLANAYQKLNKTKIDSAHLDAELLLSFILKKTREYVLARPDFELTKKQILKFNKLVAQRAQNVPLAYLTHVQEFYGRKFYVDECVLVPRPETEMIIDELRIKNYELRINTTIVDVGTGSGCIIITLVKELKNKKNIKFLATDISKDALAVARKNVRSHGVDKKIKFLQGNLLEPILKNKTFVIRHSSFVICANLPYLTPTQIKNSPTIKFEPKLALTAGKDGLKYYRQLAVQLRQFNIKYPNALISLFCEIDPKQSNKIKKIFSFAKSIAIKKDLAGRDRIAIAEF